MDTNSKSLLYRTISMAVESDISIQAKLSAVLRVLPYIEANCKASAALVESCREHLK